MDQRKASLPASSPRSVRNRLCGVHGVFKRPHPAEKTPPPHSLLVEEKRCMQDVKFVRPFIAHGTSSYSEIGCRACPSVAPERSPRWPSGF